jgi:hypothetical protein
MGERSGVIVEMNQQQRELVDRLLTEGGYGRTPGEVLRTVLRLYCAAHPDFVRTSRAKPRRRSAR